MMLSQLLRDIEEDKLKYPFHEKPSLRALAELTDDLKSSLNMNLSLDKETERRDNVLHFYFTQLLDVNYFEKHLFDLYNCWL